MYIYLVGGVGKNTYLYSAEQVNLVRLPDLAQDLLGLLAQLSREDGVRLRRGDGQWAGDGSQLVVIDKGGMSDVADLDAVLVVADNVLDRRRSGRQHSRQRINSERDDDGAAYLGTEAVPKGTDFGEALVLEVLQARLDDGVDSLLGVRVVAIGALSEPLHDIRRRGVGELVAVEDIDDDGVISVLGELVGHKLGVLPDAEDVGDVEQGDTIMLLALWLGYISVVLAYLDGLASGLAAVGVESGWSVIVCTHMPFGLAMWPGSKA